MVVLSSWGKPPKKPDRFLVPTRRRREASKDATLARPELVPTPARGNQKI